MNPLYCFGLALLNISFIFFQSTKNGEASSNISAQALKLVVSVFKPFESRRFKEKSETKESYDTITREVYHPLHCRLRKLAHMCEFLTLGFLTHQGLFLIDNAVSMYQVITALFVVLLTAVIDEFIQWFVPDRTSLVSDVLIDFSGGILGVILSILISII